MSTIWVVKTTKFIARAYEFFKKDTWLVAGCLVLSVFCAILPLVLPVLEGVMLGNIFEQQRALHFAGWLFGVGVVSEIAFLLSDYFVSKLSASVEKRVKLQILATLTKIKVKSILKTGSGAFSSRLNESSQQLATLYAQIFASIFQIFSNVAFLLFILVANVWLGLYTMLGIVLLFVVEWLRICVWIKGEKKIFEQNDQFSTFATEMIEGAGEMKFLGGSELALLKAETELEKLRKLKLIESQKQNGFQKAGSVLYWFLTFGFVLLSAMLIRDGKLLVSTFFIVYIYRVHSKGFILSAATLHHKFQSAKLATSRVLEVVDGNRKFLHQEFGNVQIISPKGKIEVKNVSFAYHYKKPVLRGANLEILPNQFVAITGESGCGKSTLLRVLVGEIAPQKGDVFVDEKNLLQLSQKSKDKTLCFVHSEPFFFSGTIKDNLLMAKPSATHDELVAACKMASVFEDVFARPAGLQTEIKKQTLSSGEQKRLAFARAIVKNTKIIIVDEPTQNLDVKNQKQVIDTLVRLSKNHTIVVATHDKDVIKSADLVFRLKNGKMIRQHN